MNKICLHQLVKVGTYSPPFSTPNIPFRGIILLIFSKGNLIAAIEPLKASRRTNPGYHPHFNLVELFQFFNDRLGAGPYKLPTSSNSTSSWPKHHHSNW
jgi:hypothetical protein